jgi:hypothetical protein
LRARHAASLAGNVIRDSLAPDQPLVTASGLSPRNMVYLSRRNILEVRTFPVLLDKLPMAFKPASSDKAIGIAFPAI